MEQMFLYSVKAFFQGKLFRDYREAFRLWLKGFALTLGLLLVIGYFVNPLIGIIVASLVGGAAQPFLFKDIKYA